MVSLKSIVVGVVLGVVTLVIALYVFSDGPSSGLIKSSMIKELDQRNKDCVVTRMTFIRAGSFVPEAHHHLPPGTAFYPIRVDAHFTAVHDDGSRGDPQEAIETLYFYRNKAHQWTYEVNSF